MIRNHDGLRFFQLAAENSGYVLDWKAGGSKRFRFNGVPFLTNGNLCNHALGIVLTFFLPVGSNGFNPAGLTSTLLSNRLGTQALCLDDLVSFLLESVKVEGCLHKEPINQFTAKGALLRTIEFISCGFRYFGKQAPNVLHRGSRQDGLFVFNLFVPLSYALGHKGAQHNAMPTFAYDAANLVLNFGPGSNDAGSGQDPSFSEAFVKATLVMLPSTEINLPPGHEWMDYKTPATTANTQTVRLEKFGLSTALDNVERGAGVDLLLWTAIRVASSGFAGPAAVRDLRRIGIPFRGQESTTDLTPFLRAMECQLDHQPIPACQDLIEETDLPVDTVGGDKATWPYPANYQEPLYDAADYASDDGVGLDDPDFFPLIFPSHDLELSKVSSYEADQQVQLDFANGHAPPAGSEHHCLAHQFKSWTPAGWDALLRKAVDSGVAADVIGTNNVTHSMKLISKNPDPAAIDKEKLRYFPHKLVPLVTPTSAK